MITTTKKPEKDKKEKLATIEQSMAQITELGKNLIDAITKIHSDIEEIKKEPAVIEQPKEKKTKEEPELPFEEELIMPEPDSNNLGFYNRKYVDWDEDHIYLTFNGKENRTKTTQTRMNEKGVKLGFYVRREKVGTKDEHWWVEYNDQKFNFDEDTLTLPRKSSKDDNKQ